jgi:hypothetical protein
MTDRKEARELIDTMKSKEDFVAFVEALRRSLAESPEQWENRTLDDYLEALGRWTEDSDGYYQNTGQPVPRRVDWKVFARALCAASVYE